MRASLHCPRTTIVGCTALKEPHIEKKIKAFQWNERLQKSAGVNGRKGLDMRWFTHQVKGSMLLGHKTAPTGSKLRAWRAVRECQTSQCC